MKDQTQAASPAFRIRPARPEDARAVYTNSRLLAKQDGYIAGYELSVEDFAAAFGSADRTFQCLVADSTGVEGDPNAILGHAIYFDLGFKVERGPAIKLEELFVRAGSRGRGVGSALMRALAAEAVARGADHLIWEVHEDNELARRFYESIGGEHLPAWTPYWLHGDALARLATE